MEISDMQVNIKYYIFLLISVKGTCLFEAKVIILYGGIFNVYELKYMTIVQKIGIREMYFYIVITFYIK